MPSRDFEVESYTVNVNQWSPLTPSQATRFINLTSPNLGHGIRHQAVVHFFAPAQQSMIGLVYNVDQPNFQGHQIYPYCWKADFADWYDILRNERPLRFSYIYDGPEFNPNQGTSNLVLVQLYTGLPEPLGEGPESLQARLHRSVPEPLGKGPEDISATP